MQGLEATWYQVVGSVVLKLSSTSIHVPRHPRTYSVRGSSPPSTKPKEFLMPSGCQKQSIDNK